MSIKPILLSTPMVRAIMDGHKTMTRRVMTPQPPTGASFLDLCDTMAITAADRHGNEYAKDVDGLYATFEYDGWPEFPVFKSRYQPGDIIWVRETWFRNDCTPDCAGREEENECPFNRIGSACYGYKAQYTTGGDKDIKWRPSIFMPREAARLFLRVADVRAERLQEITDADAIKEGVLAALDTRPRNAFQRLWDALNGHRNQARYVWDANPWVWVYTFERTDKPVGWEGMA